MSDIYQNLINGQWVDAASGETTENVNPADHSDVIGRFPNSGQEDVEAAVAAAKAAFESWSTTPAPERGEILYEAGRVLENSKEDYSAVMTREMGKIQAETRGDIQEAIDTAYYAAGEGRRMFGDTVPVEMPSKFGMSVRMPIGVCGLITPWNFPMAIPSWKIFPALICGNTVVIKPATDTPASVINFARVLEEAGVPPGVVNVVCGGGRAVGSPLVDHADVPVISFTGSSEVGREISSRAGERLKRVSLELGGKNAQIVMDDADLDLALEGALWGAFGTTGQRCTATSRVILHEAIAEEFTTALVQRASEMRLGNGLDARTEVGPVVNREQLETVERYVQIGQAEDGAELLCGGERATGDGLDNGWFHQPTIFGGVTRDMRIAREEIFGPVLACLTVGGLEEAIDVLNDTEYGLSSSIYTRDVNAAFTAIRDIQCGITYVNGPTIGAEVQLPFGGMKNTGNGHREASHTVLDVFSEWKSIYVDYSGALQRAQIDNREAE